MDEPGFYTMMAVACASMAVLFVTLGLYGILSFSVSRRTAEFGVRMAVGANRREQVPTRARAYAGKVRTRSFAFEGLPAYENWRRGYSVLERPEIQINTTL